ncbi:hypothetical protein PENTCL1PPCAC_23923, partial [Pristionchus entomophagus]
TRYFIGPALAWSHGLRREWGNYSRGYCGGYCRGVVWWGCGRSDDVSQDTSTLTRRVAGGVAGGRVVVAPALLVVAVLRVGVVRARREVVVRVRRARGLHPMLEVAEALEEGVVDGLAEATQSEEAGKVFEEAEVVGDDYAHELEDEEHHEADHAHQKEKEEDVDLQRST